MRCIRALLVIVCATASAVGEDNAAIKTKIVALEKAWNQAYKLGDAKSLGELLDDQIVLINDDGSMQSKQVFLASVKKADSREEQVSPESMSVYVYGNGEIAIATGVFRAKGIEKGKSYTRRERFVDTWSLRDGNWVCVATNATPILH
jgi:ketosteroid isomerase-like protein